MTYTRQQIEGAIVACSARFPFAALQEVLGREWPSKVPPYVNAAWSHPNALGALPAALRRWLADLAPPSPWSPLSAYQPPRGTALYVAAVGRPGHTTAYLNDAGEWFSFAPGLPALDFTPTHFLLVEWSGAQP